MLLAATNGQLEVVPWLHKNRTEGCDQDTMVNAAKKGDFQVVQFLYLNGIDKSARAAIGRSLIYIKCFIHSAIPILKCMNGYIRRPSLKTGNGDYVFIDVTCFSYSLQYNSNAHAHNGNGYREIQTPIANCS